MPDENNNRMIPGFAVYHDRNGSMGEACHCLEHHQVIFFLSGEGSYVVEGKTYRLQPGDLLLTSDREIHRDGEKTGARHDRYIAYIDSAFFEEAKRLDYNSEDLSRCFQVLSNRRHHLLRLEDQERKRGGDFFRSGSNQFAGGLRQRYAEKVLYGGTADPSEPGLLFRPGHGRRGCTLQPKNPGNCRVYQRQFRSGVKPGLDFPAVWCEQIPLDPGI